MAGTVGIDVGGTYSTLVKQLDRSRAGGNGNGRKIARRAR